MADVIFEHSDGDNDGMEVSKAPNPTHLHVTASHYNGVYMDRDAAQRLHNALGEWLYPNALGPTGYTLQQAISDLTAAVNGAATAVRPLWSKQSAYVDAGRCADHCEVVLNQAGEEVIHDAADPEPHDVGHPDPGAAECTACPHTADDHGLTGCMGAHLDFECECMQTKYDVTPAAPADEYCAPCGHSWRTHWSDQGCTAALGKGYCPCARTRPASTP